jgi:hypothetical protein
MSVISRSMRKFTERYKLTALSLKEIREGMKAVTKRLADQDVTCDGHIVAQANVINIAVLYFLKHSEAEQDRIGKELAPELERHKASATPLPITPLVASNVGRKRAAYPVNQMIVDSDALGNDRITSDHGAPKGRR